MNPQEETKPEGFVSKVEVPWCAINGRETTRQKWGKLLEETGEMCGKNEETCLQTLEMCSFEHREIRKTKDVRNCEQCHK
jgi:hypothetical protein